MNCKKCVFRGNANNSNIRCFLYYVFFSSCIFELGTLVSLPLCFHCICSWYWLFDYLLHFCLAIHVVLLPFYTWLCRVFWCLLSTYSVLFFVFWSRLQKPISPSFHMSDQRSETFHRWRLHCRISLLHWRVKFVLLSNWAFSNLWWFKRVNERLQLWPPSPLSVLLSDICVFLVLRFVRWPQYAFTHVLWLRSNLCCFFWTDAVGIFCIGLIIDSPKTTVCFRPLTCHWSLQLYVPW